LLPFLVDFLNFVLSLFFISGLDQDPDLDPDLLHGPEAGKISSVTADM